ncbi:MAG: serine phosphatase [uncultured bacterium (gcode 4)]|uniref:Serine phosphatase n=1 Tax=uncultured bacterium (gcode 4) TaxID=1234023 RepID=K1YXX4_9BACT|nr:MAG: serine phosphatase [uncultured bacterium (gcode 4)]
MFLQQIKKIFWWKESVSENITDFSDALDWIKTYRKARNYDTAIIASKEILLKNKTGVTYYEAVLKKLFVLEASNIDKVSQAAKEKRKKVDEILSLLYKRLNILEKIIGEVEEERTIAQEKEQKELQKERFGKSLKEIEGLMKKKDFSRALFFTKKLVADFPKDKLAIETLTRVQKLHDSQKTKEQKETEKREKLNTIFKEVGVETDELKNKKGVSPIKRLSLFFKQMRVKSLEKQEYVTRQRALKDIEKLLIRSGTIENVTENESNEELFSIMNSGLSKDISGFSLHGFDFYGKILGKDKIVGDTFGYAKDGNRSVFYIGDATGHGVQAGFTVALLSKLFFEFSKKVRVFQELFLTINNELKEKLKGRIFVTSIFFELDATNNKLSFAWAGHDPMFLYRKNSDTVEKIIPGWLALGVRLIKNTSSIKIRELIMENGDVLFGYTDGIIEMKDQNGLMYSLDKLQANFKDKAKKYGHAPERLYETILQEVNDFRATVPFQDDVSMFIFTRNTGKDLITNKAELQSLLKEMDVKKDVKDVNFKNKTRQQVIDDLKKERHARDLKIRLERLDRLYKMAEFTKLKQEVYLYFREWYVHDKMKFYLEKALENEQKAIIKKQDERLARKHSTLSDLYKKWEYELVVKEVIDVLFKNGKI